MQGIEIIDEALLVQNGNAILANENELWMRDVELLAVRCSDGERTKPAGQSFLQFLDIHDTNLFHL